VSKGVTDYERALVKLRAFEMLDGWGTLERGDPEAPQTLAEQMGHLGRVKQWNLTERMAKADELAAWALAPCKAEEETA